VDPAAPGGGLIAAGAAPALRVEGLTLDLPHPEGADRVAVLRDVGLSIRRGEIVGLLGPSAAGKSLLGLALLGLTPPGGRLACRGFEVGGAPVDPHDARQWRAVRGAQVGWIPQEPASALDPLRRVGKQVEEALRIHRRPLEPARVEAALAEAGLEAPSEIARLFPHQLSGGMAQRVALALAFSLDPVLLVADEPTTALDLELEVAVLEALRARARGGAGVALITHDLAAIRAYADRVLVIDAGRIVEEGRVEEVLRSPAHPVTRSLVDGTRAASPAGRHEDP
jgi:ABC-type glutathione transport system ATPase component